MTLWFYQQSQKTHVHKKSFQVLLSQKLLKFLLRKRSCRLSCSDELFIIMIKQIWTSGFLYRYFASVLKLRDSALKVFFKKLLNIRKLSKIICQRLSCLMPCYSTFILIWSLADKKIFNNCEKRFINLSKRIQYLMS